MYDKKSPAKNLNKGYGMESNSTERKDLMKDNPIDRSASGARGGSWMSKHSKSMGSPMKMYDKSPAQMQGDLDKDGKMSSYEGKRQAAIEKNMKK